jgi:hypothetical protein
MEYRSSCSCGEVKFVSASAPTRVSICHCFACQKRTGSVFGVQARFSRKDVRTEGETAQWVREVDGEKLTYHFCKRCGSTVYWFLGSMPEIVGTGVGNFTDPKFPAPTVAVFESRKHAWVEMPGLKLEHLDVVNQ